MTKENVLDEIDRKLKEIFDYAAKNGILIKNVSVCGYGKKLNGEIQIYNYEVEYEK